MEILPATAAPLAPGAPAAVRVLAGNLAAVPVGELLQAVVTKVEGGAATLTVNGEPLTVRGGAGLAPGAALLVRVPAGAPTGLEVVGRVTTPATTPAPEPAPQVARVEVLSTAPDGKVLVRIDGRAEAAVTAEPLAAGERYVLDVVRTAAGTVLRPPAEAPALAAEVAASVLRGGRPPDLGAAVKPLLAELAATPAPLKPAATGAQEMVRSILPNDDTPPSADRIRSLVKDGGLHYEAKLARTADAGGDVKAAADGDLKAGLMRLLRAAHDLGAAAAFPAARAALDGIEQQQAANVLAREQGTPVVLQIPFPDRDGWRTLNLAVEADRPTTSDEDDPAANVRLLMHVPLSGLGETWIDAGLGGDRFRAVLYVERAAARDQVRAELPALRAELAAEGFSEVLLDVRAAADLPADRRLPSLRAGRVGAAAVLDVRA